MLYKTIKLTTDVQVPLQYLAAEIELSWSNIEEGRPIFEAATKLFCNAPAVDADILPRGAHNFEFCRNSGVLRDRRLQFIRDLVSHIQYEYHDASTEPSPDRAKRRSGRLYRTPNPRSFSGGFT